MITKDQRESARRKLAAMAELPEGDARACRTLAGFLLDSIDEFEAQADEVERAGGTTAQEAMEHVDRVAGVVAREGLVACVPMLHAVGHAIHLLSGRLAREHALARVYSDRARHLLEQADVAAREADETRAAVDELCESKGQGSADDNGHTLAEAIRNVIVYAEGEDEHAMLEENRRDNERDALLRERAELRAVLSGLCVRRRDADGRHRTIAEMWADLRTALDQERAKESVERWEVQEGPDILDCTPATLLSDRFQVDVIPRHGREGQQSEMARRLAVALSNDRALRLELSALREEARVLRAEALLGAGRVEGG